MKRIDISGKKFNKLSVLSYEYTNDKGRAYYLCQCDCGNKKIIASESLISNQTKSCGCRNKEIQSRYRSRKPAWSVYGDISLSYFNCLRHGAGKRNLTFYITIEEIWELFLYQNKKCVFTGEILKFQSAARNRDGTASLDRIDSSKGYVEGNIQWVHKTINNMKKDMTDQEFIEWCKKVSGYGK